LERIGLLEKAREWREAVSQQAEPAHG
jgi:hypothetical protein